MRSSYALAASALLLAQAAAQSAPDFYVEVTHNFRVVYEASNTEVAPAGVLLDRNLLLEAPTAYAPNGILGETTYILFMIDQDVPRNGTRVPLLHYFQPNLVGSGDVLTFAADAPNASTAVGASYVPPTPPGGDGPHRYTFLLYAQPDNFVVPDEYLSINPPAATTNRIGFDIVAFAAAAGLDPPLAANYLRVLNGTAEESSVAATESVLSTGSAVVSATSVTSDLVSTITTTTATEASTTTDASTTTEASEGSGSATESAASTATSGNAAAGIVRAHSSTKELMAGLLLCVIGAGMWTL